MNKRITAHEANKIALDALYAAENRRIAERKAAAGETEIEAFEKWALSKELSLVKNSYTSKSEFDYLDIETQMFWECWQAARV